jgi:hypothetical protein
MTPEHPKLTRWSCADWVCYLGALTGIGACLIALAYHLLR